MTQYTTLNHNLKRGILRFSEKISKDFSKPLQKFITQMLFGILSCQESKLSCIARSLDEKATLKKVIERLSRNLKSFENGGKLFENYLNTIKGVIGDKSILVIDGGDITKNCATKMEGIASVRDGSTGEYRKGYHTLGITALTFERKLPIPVYTKVFTSEEEGFISEDEEVLNGLRFLSKHFKKGNIRTFDRGFDYNQYYKYLLSHKENFVIRAKKNRDVLYQGEKINILKLAQKFKGKYSLKFTQKNGMRTDCKISVIPIKLPCRPQDDLNLVVCYGFGNVPMMLITNLKSDDKRLSIAVVKVYLMRWKIEEYYRFKKQQFNLEDMRVRSLNSIRNLELLITIAVGYIGFVSEKCEERITVMQLIECSKRIFGTNKFIFYAVADGLFALLAKYKQGINHMIFNSPKPPQLQLSIFGSQPFT